MCYLRCTKKEFKTKFKLFFLCDPGGIRTHDPQLRRLLLYPAELRDHQHTIINVWLFVIKI